MENINNNESENILVCEYCGNHFNLEDDGGCNDNDIVCQHCLDEHFYYCTACGDRIHEDDMRMGDDDCYCDDCYNERFTSCHNCGDTVHNDDAIVSDGGYYYCENCYNDRFCHCEDCGNEIRIDYAYNDDDGGVFCEDCYNENHREHAGHIHDYHQFNKDIIFYNESGKNYESDNTDVLEGFELETDNFDCVEDAGNSLYELSDNEKLFHLEEDGSLSNGIEIISMPMTLNYHKNNMRWNEVLKTVKLNGGKSHDAENNTCGLHIHINKAYFGNSSIERDSHIVKILYLFEKFWSQFVKFSRRDEHSLNHYARRYNDNFMDDDSINNPSSKITQCAYNGRYFAVNLTNRKTIEFRIFKGTLKHETLLASLELIDYLVRYVKSHKSSELQLITWEKFCHDIDSVKYNNLINYMQSIGLYSISRQLALLENN